MAEPMPWTGLFARVKSMIPGAADAVIRSEIWAVMLDFTSDVNIWIEEIPFTTTLNTQVYPLTVTDGWAFRLMCVFSPARPYRWVASGISMRIPATLYFTRPLDPGQQLIAAVAKTVNNPQLDTSVVPPKLTGYPVIDGWIVNQCQDTLVYGVLANLQRMPAKTYTDTKSSGANAMLYNSGKATIRVNNMRANTYNGQAWAYPQGWSTVSRKGWA